MFSLAHPCFFQVDLSFAYSCWVGLVLRSTLRICACARSKDYLAKDMGLPARYFLRVLILIFCGLAQNAPANISYMRIEYVDPVPFQIVLAKCPITRLEAYAPLLLCYSRAYHSISLGLAPHILYNGFHNIIIVLMGLIGKDYYRVIVMLSLNPDRLLTFRKEVLMKLLIEIDNGYDRLLYTG